MRPREAEPVTPEEIKKMGLEAWRMVQSKYPWEWRLVQAISFLKNLFRKGKDA